MKSPSASSTYVSSQLSDSPKQQRAGILSSRSPPKLQMPESESVKQCIRRVEVSSDVLITVNQDVIMEAQGQLREYKKEIEMLRQEIGLMENHLTT